MHKNTKPVYSAKSLKVPSFIVSHTREVIKHYSISEL